MYYPITSVCALMIAAGTAQVVAASDRNTGELILFDVTGIESRDGRGAPINEVRHMNIGSGNSILGYGWAVEMTAFSPSWRSEMRIRISDSTAIGGLDLVVGSEGSGPSIEASLNYIKFANYNLPNITALADGLIRLEFFESYDDHPAAPDGVWNSGHLQLLATIPAPASAGLLGLVGMNRLTRPRRN